MGNLHLVTGYAGREHITSADQGTFNAAMIGSGQYVLGSGRQFEATAITHEQIRVYDGAIMMQGRFVRLNKGGYVDLEIDAGSEGYSRKDLIAARYTKDTTTGVEDVNLVVIQGTPSAENAADPDYTEGDILNGVDILNDFPLYRVSINGLNMEGIEALFEPVDRSIQDVIAAMDRINKMNPDALLKAGGTMRGALVLADDPTEDMQAATKKYTDTAISNAIGAAIGGAY